MKRIYKACISVAIGILFFSTAAFAQPAMTRTTFTAPYSPISLPAATLSTASGDDVAQSAIPIGFTFNYLGTNYTSIGLNTNGVASFDAVMSTSGTNNNLYVNNNPQNSLAPWWDNLWSDSVLYQLQGTPGNQTFTIQWTNSLSYFNTATQQLNFQVILYEGTNVIEFSYGPVITGVAAANESASIGIEGATGGAGDYIDAVTGSSFTSNGMLNAATEWPSHNFRFTPGIPSVLAGGTYTVGVTGNYYSLSEAIADVNHRGISGPVTLSLLDATYDVTPANGDNFFPMLLGPVAGSSAANTITINGATGPATINSEGTLNGNCGNKAANNIISNTNEPIFALVGASYVSLQGLTFACSATGVVDRGLMVINSSATEGSQNNSFTGIETMLNRNNTSSIGIEQRAITTPTSAAGANSNNTYYNLIVTNSYIGIYLNGNANFPDLNCQVGTTLTTSFNQVGSPVANDIGNGTNNTYGIRATNQGGVSIFNNEVQNVTQAGNGNADGIYLDLGQGTCNLYMNKVHDINGTSATGTGNITGIRANLATTGTQTARVYNNFVYNISSSFNGAATATRYVKGISVQSAGGGSGTSEIDVDFNNVRIDDASLNSSSTCFESGATNGPVINVRNNVFSNFTAAQPATSMHLAMATPTTTAIGNTGSISDYNDLYVANSTGGFTGRGQTTNYATLANWQSAMTQDANSLSADPAYFAPTDLHVSLPALNAVASMTGITWVNNDIDDQVRAVTPDIGADEFTPLLLDAGITALDSPASSGCHSANEMVMVTLKNFAAVPLDFTTDNVTVTVNITGAITQTLNLLISNNSLNGNSPLASGASLIVPVGTINMASQGVYTFNAYAVLAGDGNPLNDAMTPVNINYSAGTATSNPTSVCAGSGVTLTLNGSSPGGTIQWQSSPDGITWTNETGPGSNTSNYSVIPSDTTYYLASFCGTLNSNTDTVLYYPVTSPVATNDTICGPGTGTVSANASGTINWYDAATGGNYLATGTTYSAAVSSTTNFYASSTTGNLSQNVGLFDNSAGGAMSASANNLIFDVMQSCVLNGVYIYPNAAGTVTIDLEDNTNAVINSSTFTVTASDINQRTFVPLNFNLTPATGMQLVRNASSVNCWRNNVGVNYPYTIPGIISITASTAGNGFYYFFYDWQISYGCEGPRAAAAIVVTAPTPVSIFSTATTLCSGDSATLTASSIDPTYVYTWSPATGLSTASGATVVATPTVSASYVVTGSSSSSGCNATDTVNIVVNFIPATVVTASDSLACSGQADTLVVRHPSQSVGLFDNSAGGNMSASANNLIFDVLSNCTLTGVYIYPAAAGTVTIDLEDNTNAVINSATIIISATNVNQRTYVPLNFPLTPATGMQLVRNASSVMCWRNNVGVNYPYTLPGVLSITTSTAGNGFYYFFYDWQIATRSYNYVWSSIPAGFTANGDTAIANPAANTQYIVTITDTATGCVITAMQTVTIAPPVAVTISGNNSVCLGDSTILVADVTGGNGTVSYLWSGGLGTNDSISITPVTTANISVTVTDGCGSTSTASSTVTVSSAPPTAGFVYVISGPNTFTFTNSSANATSSDWNFGDTQTSTLANPTHVYAANGTYTVTLIVSNGCGSDTITQVLTVDGIEDATFANSVTVYPNPANDQFNISFSNGASSVTVELFDLEGKLMEQKQFTNMKPGASVPMNVEHFAAGMYLLKVSSEKGTGMFKVMVK
jgi:PKD repeat protein